MRSNNLLLTLGAGFVVLVLSGTLSYFWASMDSSGSARVTAVNKQQTPPEPAAEESSSNSPPDTGSMEYNDWEAFLAYEGKRRLMLGIRREYSAVNFRSGPSTGYSIRSTPSGGELLVPLDLVNQWYRARLKDGTVGWIHKSLVRKLRVPKPVSDRFEKNLPPLEESTKKLIPAALSRHNRVTVVEEKVNLRRGPGTQFAIVHRLYRYEEVRMLGKQKSWFRVKTASGQVGWVYEPLVEPIWLRNPEKQPTVTITGGNIRMGPEFQFRNSTLGAASREGRVLETQDPWVLVRVSNSTIGWVHRDEINQSLPGLTE